MSYRAPVKDMLFALRHLAQYESNSALPGYADADIETAQAIVEECAQAVRGLSETSAETGGQNYSRFLADVMAPISSGG